MKRIVALIALPIGLAASPSAVPAAADGVTPGISAAADIDIGQPAGETRHHTLADHWRQAIANDRSTLFGELLDAAQSIAGTAVDPAASAPAVPVTPQALVSLADKTGRTALMVASKHGDLALAQRLAALGADPQARTLTGGTPFMFAALGNHQAVADWLRRQGVDVQAAGENGWTAAMIAAAKGYADLLDWLIGIGADVDRPDVYGYTPLMRAVENQHRPAVAVLLSANPPVNVDARDEAGNTALHHAIAAGNADLVEPLLQRQARTDIANREGQTAVMLASRSAAITALLQAQLTR